MKAAWEATKKYSITAGEVSWKVKSVALPAASHLDMPQLKQTLADEKADLRAAEDHALRSSLDELRDDAPVGLA